MRHDLHHEQLHMHKPSPNPVTEAPEQRSALPRAEALAHRMAENADTCHNFPRQATTFVDRDVERPNIIQRLLDSRCQLLTLVGPGGIGKTRLAIETAQASAHAFADGATFIKVQPVRTLDELISAIGDPLGLSANAQPSPRAGLLRYLHDKQMLLVLDNFEHVADTGAELLADILDQAPDVKLFVTSRTVLNLREEWLFPVNGLPYPRRRADTAGMDDAELLASYGAVQMFVERAQRVRRGFSLKDEREGVLRICQLAEGMPLALELAAAWTKSLGCQAIADEVERNIGFLTTQLRNVPAVHRSVRAVYEQTWASLAPAEQAAFRKLAVFRGGFDRSAAETVADASLPILSSLLDHSLLRREADGRYQIHEMLRQYAEEQLNRDPTEAAATRAGHSSYYADLLHALAPESTGPNQHRVMQEIALELDNVRAAWSHAVDTQNVTNIRKATTAYYMYSDFRGRYHEGVTACESAIAALEQLPPEPENVQTEALLHVNLGWHYIRLGQLQAAQTNFITSQQQFESLGAAPPPGFGTHPALGLALAHLVRGEYADAIALACGVDLQSDDKLNRQIVYYIMANAEFARGNQPQAAAHAQRAYVLTQETGNRWMMAYVLADLGDIARALDDYEQARRHYQASYQIKQELDDPEGCAVTLLRLAGIHYVQKSYHEAQQLYQQSLGIYQKIYDRGGFVRAQHGLGIVAIAQREYETGRTHLQEALSHAAEMLVSPLTLTVLTGAAELFLRTARRDLGHQLLGSVLNNPATSHETRQSVHRILKQHTVSAPPAGHGDNGAQCDSANWLIAATRTELAIPCATQAPGKTEPRAIAAGKPTLMTAADGTLVEPLTEREQEVLELVADGLTNKEIANQLIISAGTVKWYTGQIYGKLGVNKRTQAVARARELSLLN